MSDIIATESCMVLTELPPELLRSISLHLSWTDTLLLRASCTKLHQALTPRITHLCFPVVSTPYTWGDRNSTTEKLTSAFARLGGVTCVTLLLILGTGEKELLGALQAVSQTKNITKLVLQEVEQVQERGSWHRSYAPALQLSGLVHVEDLKISTKTATWTLEGIWKQVCAMGGHTNHTDNNSNAAPAAPSSSPGQATDSPNTPASPYALRRLSIQLEIATDPSDRYQSWSLDEKPTCDLQDLTLPSQLTYLSTSLPGEYNPVTKAMGALDVSQEGYVRQLAAGLPELLSLTVTGSYGGRVEVFDGFGKLRELRCQPDTISPNRDGSNPVSQGDNLALLLASRVGALERLELLRPQRKALERIRSYTRGLHPPARPWSQGYSCCRKLPFKLEWLQHNTELQHLAVDLIESGQDLSAVNGQLRSLSGRVTTWWWKHEHKLLSEVLAVSSALTSLELFHSGPNPTPRLSDGWYATHHLIQLPQLPCPLSNLQTLALLPDNSSFYTVSNPAALWAGLPALTSLKLQNVALGSSQLVAEGRFVFWPQHLPCSRLKQLEISRYAIVLSHVSQSCNSTGSTATASSSSGGGGGGVEASLNTNQPQQQQQQQQGENQEQRQLPNPTSSSSSGDLLGLQHLSLVDCCGVLLSTNQHECRKEATAGPQLHIAATVAPDVVLEQLVSPAASGSSSSLRSLWLHGGVINLSAIENLCRSPVGQELEELHIHTANWLDSNVPVPTDGHDSQQSLGQPHPDSEGVAAALAAASKAGNLQRLRHLSVDLTQPLSRDRRAYQNGGERVILGMSALRACSGFKGLQQLHLLVDAGVEGMGPLSWCGCIVAMSYGKLPFFEGPWSALLDLPCLRVVEVEVLCSVSKLGPVVCGRQYREKKVVVGVCSRCGGAVSESRLRKWLECVAASMLPGCHIRVKVARSPTADC